MRMTCPRCGTVVYGHIAGWLHTWRYHPDWLRPRDEPDMTSRRGSLVCIIFGHAVAWGPCNRCGRRARG
jgi:hypothetical protein